MCPQRPSSSATHTLYRRSEFDAYETGFWEIASSPLAFKNPHNLWPFNPLKSGREIGGLLVFGIHLIDEG